MSELIGVCGHVVVICPNGDGDPFICNSFCAMCEGFGEYCKTCEGKPKLNVCPRCSKADPSVLLDNEGEAYMCDECWNDDGMPQRRCECGKPEAPGWHVSDDAGITFGGLKQAQNEASNDMAQWIAHIFFTKSEKLFTNLMYDIVDGVIRREAYHETCEWVSSK